MSERVKAVEIVFENLEYIFIPAEHIGAVSFQDVSYSIGFFSSNAILKKLHAKSAYIQINKSFSCDISKHDEHTDLYEEFETRIFIPNITYFRVHYSNEAYEDIYVSWEDCEDDEYMNRLQKTSHDEEGNVVISINEYTVEES